jgi:hypothetical protein
MLTSRFSYRDDSFDGLTRVFPIHDACFSILTRTLTGSIESDLLNKDSLYEVMECLVSSNSALDIDYGGILGPDQFWVSERGEEVSEAVTNKIEVNIRVLMDIFLVCCCEPDGQKSDG